MVDELLDVRWIDYLRFQNTRARTIVITLSETMTLDIHSDNDKSHLAPDDEGDAVVHQPHLDQSVVT
jgi:hypothetical protein